MQDVVLHGALLLVAEGGLSVRILLSNDDGIEAEGLHALVDVLAKDHEVVICAPMREQSGMAHALNVRKELEVVRRTDVEARYGIAEVWAIDGTPTDCVKIYLEAIAGVNLVDLVISGINHGSNLATDVLYSGTVGAAMEARLHDICAIAVSLDKDSEVSYSQAAKITAEYLEKNLMNRKDVFFQNINFPKRLRRGRPEFIYTRLGKRDYINAFSQHTDEDGRTYYTVAGEIYDTDCSEATDIYAVGSGYIAVTPLQTELTDFMAMDEQLDQ